MRKGKKSEEKVSKEMERQEITEEAIERDITYKMSKLKECVQEDKLISGGTFEELGGINSVKTCTKECKKTTGCTALSYSTENRQCHLKNGAHTSGKAQKGIQSVVLACLQNDEFEIGKI